MIFSVPAPAKKVTILLLAVLIAVFCPAVSSASPPGQTPSGIPYSEMESRIDNYVHGHIGKTSAGAAVVVVKDGAVIFAKGYGYADIENKIAVDPAHTVFEYASISKLFVYTTLMRLAEEGRIDLQDDIRTYLPAGFLKKLRYDEPITFMHVMNHTTGFEDYLFDLILTSPDNLPTLEQALLTSQPAQVYRPGTVSAYSNYAVALAAYIAQRITGQDYYAYLMDTFFVPLGMDSTSAHPLLRDRPSLVQRKAAGYYPQTGEGFKRGDWSYIPLYPAGSINGTTQDLARFTLALLPPDGQKSPLFQKRETLAEMLSRSYAMGPGLSGFAHGLMEREGRNKGLGHGGSSACFRGEVNIVPEERFGVIVLCNTAGETELTEGLTHLLLGTAESDTGAYAGKLPDAHEVEGAYIAARRAHTGFLKLHGFLSIVQVRALGPDSIEMSLAGQSAVLTQTAPYVFERVSSSGPIFQYHFGTVYFDIADGAVRRVSGDFLPLPAGYTVSWLKADAAMAIACTAFFVLAPFVLLIRALLKRNRRETTSGALRARRLQAAFILCGTGLVLNNALLLARMLVNNYRSFAEVRFQLLLNYPLVILAAATGLALTLCLCRNNCRRRDSGLLKDNCLRKDKIALFLSALLLAALVALLIKWDFFHIF